MYSIPNRSAALGLLLTLIGCGTAGEVETDRPLAKPESAPAPGRLAGDVVFEGMNCAPDRPRAVPPCSGPYAGYEVVVLSADGKTAVGSVVTGENGGFSIELPAGSYVIRLSSGSPSLARREERFTVDVGEETEIHLVVDTGVR